MKRIIVFFLVVCMIVVITGCGDTPNNNAETAPAAPSEATASGSSVTGSTPQSNTVSGPERPALLISDGKIIEEKSDGNFYYYSFKVKNTTDQTLHGFIWRSHISIKTVLSSIPVIVVNPHESHQTKALF